MDKKETYKAQVMCTNCHHQEILTLPKGKTIEQAECSDCGCMTLVKSVDTYNPWGKGKQTNG